MADQRQDQRERDEPNLNPYHTAESPGVNDDERWVEAPGYSTAGAGESGMEGRPATVISPPGTGTPGDASGPDLSGLPPSGPLDAPDADAAANARGYHPERGYNADGGLGGAEAVGMGTQAGKELGQTTNRRLKPSGMPDRSDLAEKRTQRDAAGVPASLGTGSAGAAIDTEALIGVPDTGIEPALSTRGLDERDVPGNGSTTDNPENLGMGAVDGPTMPAGD
jgi:hypothetical protein